MMSASFEPLSRPAQGLVSPEIVIARPPISKRKP